MTDDQLIEYLRTSFDPDDQSLVARFDRLRLLKAKPNPTRQQIGLIVNDWLNDSIGAKSIAEF